MMSLRIPPHVGWPLFIITLLSISIFAAGYTYVQANSGGGAQVIEDYYQRALDWDQEASRRQNAERLGWKMDVRVSDEVENGLRAVYLMITGTEGTGIEGIHGTVRAYRPHLSNAVAEVPLVAIEGRPGLYRQLMPAEAPGLWDFELRARSDAEAVFIKKRVDIRR
jgi:hypothetical protein